MEGIKAGCYMPNRSEFANGTRFSPSVTLLYAASLSLDPAKHNVDLA